jgi:hypothetical protein
LQVAVRAGEEAWSPEERRGAQRAMGTSERQWASVYDNGMDERTVALGLSRLARTKPPETPSPLKRGRVTMEGDTTTTPATPPVVVRALGVQFGDAAAAAPAGAAAAAAAAAAAGAPAAAAAAAPAGAAAAAPAVRRQYCVSEEVARTMSMAKLCAQWSLIYGRKCQTQNKPYLIRSVTYPGLTRVRTTAKSAAAAQDVKDVHVATEDPAWVAGSEETSEEEEEQACLGWDDYEEEDESGTESSPATSPHKSSASDDERSSGDGGQTQEVVVVSSDSSQGGASESEVEVVSERGGGQSEEEEEVLISPRDADTIEEEREVERLGREYLAAKHRLARRRASR